MKPFETALSAIMWVQDKAAGEVMAFIWPTGSERWVLSAVPGEPIHGNWNVCIDMF